MQIHYLGHAGFLVETETSVVVMDPWLSDKGAFDMGWFQFPCNHHLADVVILKLKETKKKVYVYVSHEHKDHFDLDFLLRLKPFNFDFVIPKFRRSILFDSIKTEFKQEIILCDDSTKIELNKNEYIKIYSDDSELNRDSAILFSSNGRTFFNSNDCKIHDRFGLIKREEGNIDVFAVQFSGATWHPTCYDYPEKEYQRISKKKKRSKFEATALAIEAISPRVYIPSAGPACFLDPDLIHLNFQKDNIFPRNAEVIKYLGFRLENQKVEIPDLAPGNSLFVGDEIRVIKTGGEQVLESEFESYILNYASRYFIEFENKKKLFTRNQFDEIKNELIAEFKSKLDAFKSKKEIDRLLYVQFRDQPSYIIAVDFQNDKVKAVNKIPSGDHYLMQAFSYDLKRVLDGHITWEDFSLTFRMRLNREPDVYQVLMQGFLILEAADMNYFCDKILEIENRTERIIVEVGGCRYSVDRFCPHQGADLTFAWKDGNQYLVCPRHRWFFDLENGGKCLSNSGTINAIPLEES